jgi:hypothetical protein
MSLLKRKKDAMSRGVKAPAYDPYGRFSNSQAGPLGFRKDKHVVLPGVTFYEKLKLKKVKDYVEKSTSKPCTLSDELINDVYSIYANDDIKRRPSDASNSIRHKVLDKVYDSLTKIVTVNSPLYTQILTRELALALQIVDDEVKEEQKKQNQSGQGDGDGESEGLESSLPSEGDGEGEGSKSEGEGEGEKDNKTPDTAGTNAGKASGTSNRSSIEDIVDKALSKAEKNIEKAKNNADTKIKDLESQIGKEAMKDLMNTEPEFLEKIEELKSRLSNVSINKDSIRKILEKILNESMNYFSTKFKRVEESLFDCEECEDLFGLEFLHPVFKNAEIMSVGNETRLYKGKIDLFLDCSSSMNSSENFEGSDIRMIDLAKGIAMVLYRMGMIENLYFFDGGLYKIDNVNEITILSFSKSGGTNFNNVIDKIKENGNNSVIVTDGYDSCAHYDKKAFWVGIGGTKFDRNDAFSSYRSNGQCVAYESSTNRFNYCKQ